MASEQTLLWIDLHNFVRVSELLQGEGSVWFSRFMREYYQALTRAPKGEHNRLVGVVGDGLLFVFGQPIIKRTARDREQKREQHRERSVRNAMNHFTWLTEEFKGLMSAPDTAGTSWAQITRLQRKEVELPRFRLALVGGLHMGAYEEFHIRPRRGHDSWSVQAGSGINVACRLVELDKGQQSGGLFVSQTAYRYVPGPWKRKLKPKSLGKKRLRHVRQPIRVWFLKCPGVPLWI